MSELAPSVRVPFEGEVLTGRLERRYKRFFVDLHLDGEPPRLVTAHTPNTGAMAGLLEPGAPVLVTHNPSPTRKLAYTLQAIRVGHTWVGTNTHLPNRLAELAVTAGVVEELKGYGSVRREVKHARSRVDLFLDEHAQGRAPCWVEVKSVTLREGRFARFPDAKSERGLKHLEDLVQAVREGHRAAMLYIIQRTDCAAFGPADLFDPAYGDGLRAAKAAGVEILCLVAGVDKAGVRSLGSLPIDLARGAA
jgi:sugar fermentation stimulation protein A